MRSSKGAIGHKMMISVLDADDDGGKGRRPPSAIKKSGKYPLLKVNYDTAWMPVPYTADITAF